LVKIQHLVRLERLHLYNHERIPISRTYREQFRVFVSKYRLDND